MSDPSYAYPYPYPTQGYYQGPPVMASPQYPPPPPPQYPPKKETGFLAGCLAGLHCCCLIGDCC